MSSADSLVAVAPAEDTWLWEGQLLLSLVLSGEREPTCSWEGPLLSENPFADLLWKTELAAWLRDNSVNTDHETESGHRRIPNSKKNEGGVGNVVFSPGERVPHFEELTECAPRPEDPTDQGPTARLSKTVRWVLPFAAATGPSGTSGHGHLPARRHSHEISTRTQAGRPTTLASALSE